ncbi:endonuclease/exonuclease/phosphatase family protein [Aliiroseovarius sp. KMU-50]|uniref:Endonuclease/exonuclease/phosphatase family protein n=1 Tax=Aliiroseovarius salicola TaxID=3009082 RepID=A0ABT4W1B0_9RHOB|nr:endonuclease/exonuclease/phosphatase family protein [Aliiroseovarius sp. KMU-50]MDA5094297.1 endonuclease/exonuclease/phosphatase family protein [Aliiroseovarius sp. KMU-50]
MTYNIRKAIGLDRRRDPHRVMEAICQADADVVVLQEADRRLGQRKAALPFQLIEDESDYEVAPLAANGVSLGSHGNAILVRRGVKMARPERISLPGLEPRGAVSIEIAGGLRVVGCHLGLMRRYRHQQMRRLAEALEQGTLPTVILGDFNEWSHHRGFEPMDREFDIHDFGKSYHASRPVAALDRLIISPGVEILEGHVVMTPLTRIASDHLPVWARISVNVVSGD